jgi:hypothetical protein
MKMTVFWDVAPCGLVEVDRHFRGAYCLHHQVALMVEAVSTSETSVNFYETTRRNIPEDLHPFVRQRIEDSIEIDLREVGCDDGRWMELAEDRAQWVTLVLVMLNFRILLPV